MCVRCLGNYFDNIADDAVHANDLARLNQPSLKWQPQTGEPLLTTGVWKLVAENEISRRQMSYPVIPECTKRSK